MPIESNLTCKGCLDYETCRKEERIKETRCKDYARSKDQAFKDLPHLQDKPTKIYGLKWIRHQMPSDKKGEGSFREIPFSNLRKEGKRRVEKQIGKGYWSD